MIRFDNRSAIYVNDRSYMLSLVTHSSAIYVNDRSYKLSVFTDSRTTISHLAKKTYSCLKMCKCAKTNIVTHRNQQTFCWKSICTVKYRVNKGSRLYALINFMIADSKLMKKRNLCSGSWLPPRIHFQPFPVCHHDGFTAGKHKKRSTLADDVVLWPKETDVLESELEQWRAAFEKRGMKVLRAKTEYMCLNGTPLRSVKMESHQLPQVTKFK